MKGMRAIFISYRRDDTEGQAGRLYDDLVEFFGDENVFMDVAGIEPGRDFRRAIDEQVTSCGVLLAMIGRNWINAMDATGRPRLEDPSDFVRLETASALKREIPVIPVLVHGAAMPHADQLPADLADLAYRNAVELTHARWNTDVGVLVKALRPYVEKQNNDLPTLKASTANQTSDKTLTPESPGSSGQIRPGVVHQILETRFRRRAYIVIAMLATVAIGVYSVKVYTGEEVPKRPDDVRSKGPVNALEGIRLVYIQYENQVDLAKRIQASLKQENVKAPGTERVKDIQSASIRYFRPSDRTAAENLQKFIQAKVKFKIENLIDLSGSGYSVPSGQLEVWVP